MKQYDYIIAGAGAAGLSLLREFINHPAGLDDKKILVVDRALSDPPDKTWCFWEAGSFALPELIHHSWKDLEVRFGKRTLSLSPEKYSYHCVRSREYHAHILEQAQNAPSVTLLDASIQEIRPHEERPVLVTDEGSYEASWIFQSCFIPSASPENGAHTPLKQHFLGWEIHLKRPLLDPGMATFMDFDVTQQEDGLSFMYVLPFTPVRALVEYTVFGRNLLEQPAYEEEIRTFLSNRFALKSSDYQIKRREFGWVPMSDQRFRGWYGDRVLNTGLAGGTAKPSTGYSFIRAHQHARQIVRRLANNKAPQPFKSAYRYRIYDLQLLHLLYHKPKLSLRIFEELFRNNPIDRLLAFLGEESTPLQDLAVMNSVPYTPFLKALNQIRGRVLSGR